MGVPKFFRWISERYPAISQLIAENRIPEFDCLYLDMNGIIHNCTHKDSDRPDFRMTEDAMFIAIFNYIEHLFGKIKPQKLFFMAIDGVAPRAKMNQQRARRFRTAYDNEKAREKAIAEGLEMPKEPPFDSNCITPGTEFMARLTQQLKYFISKKVSEDADWQGVEVILSGHEVPGEGEHKIMEYIRQAKSQPGYDPNVRHCLYGLDADLIMLGLLSHDPHFCLLREEVTFGRQATKKSTELEHQNFYLMHLCIVREYLELEFQQLKEPGALSFPFDMERVIDDFILMAFFVGNDFLPNLPHLHINEGALALMFETYKKVLPEAKGYINEGGTINLQRLALLLDELSKVEFRFFEAENSDASWLKSKQRMDSEETGKDTKKGKLVISTPQQQLFQGVKKWVNQAGSSFNKVPYNLPKTLPARDREFVKSLAGDLHLQWDTVEDENGDRNLQITFPPALEEDEDDDDEEAQSAIFRVIKRYDNAKVVDVSAGQAHDEMEKKYQQKFQGWKNKYYEGKLEWEGGLDNEDEMRKLTENYVQGLQWVLYYYYRGVASWPWYFQYHYSPMISDVRRGLGVDMNFKLGQPFHPYEQLMGVLPDRSKSIVPEVYWPLMTESDSPIIDFYPRDFELDMNGKKMEWEAVVKIPFIQEDRLLAAMKPKNLLLSEREQQRNAFGVSLKFTYSADVNYTYPSSLPGVFNDIPNCKCVENIYELPTMDGLEVYVGLTEGVKLGEASLAGFPSLKVLPFSGNLAFHGVNVFQQDSRNQSQIATLLESETKANVEVAKQKLGKVVHVGYPFLSEAKIVSVSDELFEYTLPPGETIPVAKPHGDFEIREFRKKAERIEQVYSKRLGIITGPVESLVHVEMLKGLIKTNEGAMIKAYGEIPGVEIQYAPQTVVDNVLSEDQRFLEKAALPIEEEFPVGARAFFLGTMAYGRPLEVAGYTDGGKVDVWLGTIKHQRADVANDLWARQLVRKAETTTPYTPSFAVAKMLHLNGLALSKITSSLMVNSRGLRVNLGLNLKFEAKKQKVLGYSRKGSTGWEFSQKAINLITQFMVNFPDFIAGLQRNPQGDHYNDTDFYAESEAPGKIKEIGDWLKSIQSKSFERVTLDAEQLDSDVVLAIEQTADAIGQTLPAMESKKVKGVPRHALLKPADAEQRLSAQTFNAGDRILYVQDSGKVPVGLSGTVVGLTRTSRTTLLDVVLDNTFMSGTTLGDRCSPFRGATVPATAVLNLTNRQVIVDTRANAARHQQQPASTGMYVNGYGAPTGPGATGQLLPAKAPSDNAWRGGGARGGGRGAPAQNGAHGHAHENGNGNGQQRMPYRPNPNANAGTNGFQRGGARGGRGGNKAGFTVVDNSDPTEGVVRGNPNFRPQNYSNVAPPASLDLGRGGPRGGGRGRGRGGGRGFSGPHRGRGGQAVPQ